ncbi:MAG: putative 2-aminoethylphosphonate ABC transporter permease subunit, partial [Hyphomicrobiales bacterium]
MSDTAIGTTGPVPLTKPKVSRDDWIMRGWMAVLAIFLVFAILLPLYVMLSKSFENKAGDFIGLANFQEYFSTPALFLSAFNSLYISIFSSILVMGIAFVYAYALTRTCMPFKWFSKLVAAIPLLTPSMFGGISLV